MDDVAENGMGLDYVAEQFQILDSLSCIPCRLKLTNALSSHLKFPIMMTAIIREERESEYPTMDVVLRRE